MTANPKSLSLDRVRQLLAPFDPQLSPALAGKLLVYLDLLLRWNSRTNLTAIRDPETIVLRHFGESLFTALQLPPGGGTLLDLGSGAGFPGLPIALARPDWQVTLAESQGKKAAFLQEAVRTLGVDVEVWSRRVELMPSARRFRVVTLRAVDTGESAVAEARMRVAEGGALFHLTSRTDEDERCIAIPGASRRVLHIENVLG